MAQTINVNTNPESFPATLYFSQGDIGREFDIVLASSDGYAVPAGATVTMVATKPSGFGFSVTGTLTNNVASFVTTETMTNEAGRFPAEIRIEYNGDVIGTANFYLDGEPDPHPADTIDGDAETIIPELTVLVERVESAASSVLDMQVVATTLPAGSDATYSYDEETNTATFGIPKGADGTLSSGVLAPTYSTSATYAVGDYVYYSGSLYRCTTAITTAESWTSGHWTQVALAPEVTDLKSAFNNIYPTKTLPTAVGQVSRIAKKIDVNGIIQALGNSIILPIVAGRNYVAYSTDQWGSNFALLTSRNLVAGQAPDYATGYTGFVTLSQNTKVSFVTPSNARFIMLRCDDDNGQNALHLIEYSNLNQLDDAVVDNKTFDLSGFTRMNYCINSSNVWAYDANVYRTVLIPTVAGQTISFKTSSNDGSVYALLKDSSVVDGQSPNFCTGYEQRYLFAYNETVDLVIPSDCKYLALRADVNVADNKFAITTTTFIKDQIQSIDINSKHINMGSNTVYVAASNSTDNDKQSADFVCTGTNDEVTIQRAINSIYGVKSGAEIVLMSGDYYVDSFPNTNFDGHVAIMLPSKQSSDTIGTDVYSVLIRGAVYNAENVVIHVTQDAYDAMNTTDSYSVFGAQNDWYYNHYAFHDLRVYVPSAQKKIVCYDGRRMGSMECRRLKAIALDHATWDTPVEEIVLPNFHSIGVAGACWDSNSWNYIWESIYCIGFGQGFAVGGEHLLAIKCVAIYGRYGFTFHANMDSTKVAQGLTPSHPDTLIDCSDEANANFWLFGGDNVRRPIINCYDLSIEYWANWFSIEGAGNFATEEDAGQFSGFISYAISGGDVAVPFWANGSGHNFTTVNLNQVKQTTTAIRNTYAPNMGQQVFDTTLNKLVICTEPHTKEWRDALGNIV